MAAHREVPVQDDIAGRRARVVENLHLGTGGEAKAHDGLRRPERFPVVRGKRCWWPWPATRKTAARRPWATPSAALRRPWHIRFSFRPQPGRGAPAAVVIVTSPRPGIAVARRLRNSGAIPSTVR